MRENPSPPETELDTIFEAIKDARGTRDAAARNCVDSLLQGDTHRAMWFAQDSRAWQLTLDDLLRKMRETIPKAEE